jgi:SAM-dependent methyltransferase
VTECQGELENGLANSWFGKRITRTPALVVGKKPNCTLDRQQIMTARINFVFPNNFSPANERVTALLAGCAHYAKYDQPLFIAGYNELCRLDLNGRKVLEICCGLGELTCGLGRAFPQAEIIGLDRYTDGGGNIREAARAGSLGNVRYLCGNALHLKEFGDASLDLVYGQATLHHLGHDTDACQEFSRVLKPGGRLVFIFEPFGHNPVWAMIRAYRIAKAGYKDESNVVLDQLEQIARGFGQCEIQPFNFLGYPVKSLGRYAGRSAIEFIYRLDQGLMRRSPGCALRGANFNVVFTK